MEEDSQAEIKYKNIVSNLKKKCESIFKSLEIKFDNQILALKINK